MKIKKVFLIIVFCTYSFIANAFDLEVDVLSNDYQPISLLISDFYVDKKSEKIYNSFKKIISEDLNNSGVFDLRFSYDQIIVSNIDFKNIFEEIDLYPYNHYQYIVVGKIIALEDKKVYSIELSLLNSNGVSLKNVGYKLPFNYKKQDIDQFAHDISNEIYEGVLEVKGYFSSSLIFVSGNKLIMSDYNGENQHVLLKTKGTILAPVFSNDGKMIVYVDFFEGRSVIYIYDILLKKTIKLANFKGLSLSPMFSNDDKKIIFAIANGGSTHIHQVSIEEGKLSKVTEGYSINMPGNFSPNNDYIVFNSDRAGAPKIYTYHTGKKTLRKISKEVGSYYTPSFSNNSNLILFTKIHNRKFNIGLLSMSGKEKILTSDTLAESPSWLSDGRHIIYQYAYGKQGRKNLYSFYIMDLLSGYKMLIKPSKDAQDPNLSNGVIPTKKISAKYYF